MVTVLSRRNIQRYLSWVIGVTPRNWAHAVREKNFRNRGQSHLLVALRKVLERGDFHERADFDSLGSPSFKFSGNDSIVTRTVYWHGPYGYESGQVRIWEHLCREAEQIREVGANVGLYSIVGGAANRCASYHAYEPHPKVFQELRKNILINRLANVQPIAKAVVPTGSDSARNVKLQVFDENVDWHELPTGAFISEIVGFQEGLSSRFISVPAVSARAIFAGADLIKLDVEGAEGLLLRDAAEEILANRPIILLECLPETADLWEQLVNLRNAEFSVISPSTGEEVEPLTIQHPRNPTSPFAVRDNFVVPDEKLDSVRTLIASHGAGSEGL